MLLRIIHQLLQIAAWNAPLSACHIPNVEALDLAVRKLLVEGPLEVEELIVLFLFFEGSRQMPSTYEETCPPAHGLSIPSTESLPTHRPPSDIHNRNDDEQLLTHALDGQVRSGREEGSIAIPLTDAA
ncbi:MAG TPA: hypothetical protein VHW45_17160 [Candidatus Sulfotelmatobacter sp.]|nr:hypothetical protein [Candidatus Sulfotelmatobacter sp.]